MTQTPAESQERTALRTRPRTAAGPADNSVGRSSLWPPGVYPRAVAASLPRPCSPPGHGSGTTGRVWCTVTNQRIMSYDERLKKKRWKID